MQCGHCGLSRFLHVISQAEPHPASEAAVVGASLASCRESSGLWWAFALCCRSLPTPIRGGTIWKAAGAGPLLSSFWTWNTSTHHDFTSVHKQPRALSPRAMLCRRRSLWPLASRGTSCRLLWPKAFDSGRAELALAACWQSRQRRRRSVFALQLLHCSDAFGRYGQGTKSAATTQRSKILDLLRDLAGKHHLELRSTWQEPYP